jgi:hypothetical protein
LTREDVAGIPVARAKVGDEYDEEVVARSCLEAIFPKNYKGEVKEADSDSSCWNTEEEEEVETDGQRYYNCHRVGYPSDEEANKSDNEADFYGYTVVEYEGDYRYDSDKTQSEKYPSERHRGHRSLRNTIGRVRTR